MANAHDEAFSGLRTRSLSLKAYVAFIEHQFNDYNFMVALQDLSDNSNSKFDSPIDAVAYKNNFLALKIYQPSPQGLRLAHSFVPSGAKIAYIYNSGSHFQALIPIEINEMMDVVEDSESASDEESDIFLHDPENS